MAQPKFGCQEGDYGIIRYHRNTVVIFPKFPILGGKMAAEERYAMTMRLPISLANEIKKIAAEDRRKITATIEMALEDFVRQRTEANERTTKQKEPEEA